MTLKAIIAVPSTDANHIRPLIRKWNDLSSADGVYYPFVALVEPVEGQFFRSCYVYVTSLLEGAIDDLKRVP